MSDSYAQPLRNDELIEMTKSGGDKDLVDLYYNHSLRYAIWSHILTALYLDIPVPPYRVLSTDAHKCPRTPALDCAHLDEATHIYTYYTYDRYTPNGGSFDLRHEISKLCVLSLSELMNGAMNGPRVWASLPTAFPFNCAWSVYVNILFVFLALFCMFPNVLSCITVLAVEYQHGT